MDTVNGDKQLTSLIMVGSRGARRDDDRGGRAAEKRKKGKRGKSRLGRGKRR